MKSALKSANPNDSIIHVRVDGKFFNGPMKNLNKIRDDSRRLESTPTRKKTGRKIANNKHETTQKVVPRFGS